MNSISVIRINAQEIQNMNIVVVHGVIADRKDICALGWVEDL